MSISADKWNFLNSIKLLIFIIYITLLYIPAFCAEEQSDEVDDIIISQLSESVEIDMDYYQLIPITIKNIGDKTHKIKVSAINPYSDIYLGFISERSEKENIGFAPGDEKTLLLSINAQEAASSHYNIIIDIVDQQSGQEKRVPLNIIVRHSNLSFAFEEVTGPVDAQSATKRFFVKNVGDEAPDIDVLAGDDIAGKVIIQRVPRDPSYLIEEGEGVNVTVTPLLSKEIQAISGNLIAKWGNRTWTYPIEFRCDGDVDVETLTDPILYFNLKRSGCINKGTVNDLFYLPSGIKENDVDYAYIDYEIDPDYSFRHQYKEYNVMVEFNGHPFNKFVLAPLKEGAYKRHLRLDIKRHLNFSNKNGPNANRVHLTTDMDHGYLTPLSDARAVICLKGEYDHYICLNASASSLPPYIYLNSKIAEPNSKLDLRIDSPAEGGTLDTSEFIVASVRCNGENIPFCRVSAELNLSDGLSDDLIYLFDNGQNNDGVADDGIYGAPMGYSRTGSCHLSIKAYIGGVSCQNETDFTVTREFPMVDDRIIKLVDPVLSIDSQKLFEDGAIIIDPSAPHSISLHSNFENPSIINNYKWNSIIDIKLSDQNMMRDGFIRILNSSGEKNLDITMNSTVSFQDDPAVYGLKTLEFSAMPKEDEHFIQPGTIFFNVFLTPYKFQSHGEGPVFYRLWREDVNLGQGNVTIICSPEYEQHLAYSSSKDPSVTSFIAYLQLLGLTELAKKYPDAEVILIPFSVEDGQDDICAAIERYVQQARREGRVPLIVGAVPHSYVSYSPSNLIASQSYKAAYMSYAQASGINSMTYWDNLSSSKRALITGDSRSEKIARPVAKKYEKDSFSLNDTISYPLLLLCRKDMPLLQISPEITTADLKTQGALNSIYSIQRIGPLVPVDHTFYLGGSVNAGPFSISLNPTSLTISAGYKKIGIFYIVGDSSGTKAKSCIWNYCKALSLNDAMNDSSVTQIISKEDLIRLDKSVSDLFSKSSATYKDWLSDYVEPDSVFSMLGACTENIVSFDQPVYESVESVRDSYPASTREANAIFAGVSLLSDISQIAGYAGLPASLTARSVPEILTYANRDNDINYILLNESVNKIEAVQSTFLIPESGVIGDVRLSSIRKQAESASSSGARKLLEQIALGGAPMNTGNISKSLQKGLASSAKSLNLYLNSQDLATFSSKELYYLGNPDLGDTGGQKKTASGGLSYDDPEDAYQPKYLPGNFSVNITSLPERFELLGKNIIYANITGNETDADGLKVRAYSTIAAAGTGIPPIPIICIILNSPSSQAVDDIDVSSGDSIFLNVSLPLIVARAHDKPLSGLCPDGTWPAQSWSYTSSISGNSSNTIIYLYPFKYNSLREGGRYNCTFHISVKMSNLTEENDRTTLRLESYPDSIAINPGACFPLKVRAFNDMSSIGNASDVCIRAEASEGVNISSDDAQRNSDGSLQWPALSLGRSATDYNAFLQLKVCIGNNTSIDAAPHSINITSEYRDGNVLRGAAISIPIVLIPSDSVDLAVSGVTLKNETIGQDNLYWVDASIENVGRESVIMAQVMLFIDGVCQSQESIPAIESGSERNVSFSFRPVFGRHNLSVAVAASPSEVNLQNNCNSLGKIYFQPVEQWIGPSGANVSAVAQSMLKGNEGFIILGVSQSEKSNTSGTVLINISNNGSIAWESELSPDNFAGYTIVKSGDDYIVAGSIMTNDLEREDLFATRCSSNGSEKPGANWLSGKNSRERILSACETADGGFLFTGYAMNRAAKSDVLLIRALPGFPGDRKKKWDRSIEMDGRSWSGISVEECWDKSIIIAGSIDTKSGNDTDLFLLKADFEINPVNLEIWNETFGGGEDDFALAIDQSQDGGYVVLGCTSSFGKGGSDIWLLKTDADGREMWNRTYGAAGNDGAGSFFKTFDGGYLISGYSTMPDRCIKPWIIKTDAHGFEEWNMTLGETGKAISAVELDDGCYVVAGYSESCGRSPSNETEIWIRKLRPAISEE